MLFSVGMGIGLVFYGAEPMADFASPPNPILKLLKHIQKHYVLHFSTGDSMLGSVYGVVALALAYAQFRKMNQV